MAITIATPEEDAIFKKLIRNAPVPDMGMLPSSVKRDMGKQGFSFAGGIGDLPIVDLAKVPNASYRNPGYAPISPENQIAKAFADQGVSIFDPRNPMNISKQGTGLPSSDEIFKLLLGDGPGFTNASLTHPPGPGGTTSTAPAIPNATTGLPGQAYTFSNAYKPPTGTSDTMFQNLISSIGAPSSVDAVQKQLDNQKLEQLLSQIDLQTNQDLASTKLDFLDRGIGGPGQISDIEANALAQVRSGAARTKAGARTTLQQSELDRQKQKEQALQAALMQGFTSGVQKDIAGQNVAATGAASDVQALNNLLSTQYTTTASAGESAADRALKSGLGYAGLRQGNTGQLLQYLLGSAGLEQKNQQFYDELMANIENNAAERINKQDLAYLGIPDNMPNYLNAFAKIAGLFI